MDLAARGGLALKRAGIPGRLIFAESAIFGDIVQVTNGSPDYSRSMPFDKADCAVAFNPGNSSDAAMTPAFAEPNSSSMRFQNCDCLM